MQFAKNITASGFGILAAILLCAILLAHIGIYIWIFVVLLSSDQLQCKTADLQTWAWVTLSVSVVTCVLQVLLGRNLKFLSTLLCCFQIGWLIYGMILTWGENTCKEETPDLYEVCNIYLIMILSTIGVCCLIVCLVLGTMGVAGVTGYAKLQEEEMESEKV